MRKILFLLVTALLISGGVAYAVSDYALKNAQIVGSQGGPEGISPATEIIRVRYGLVGLSTTSISSQDIVLWDTTSADGVTVIKGAGNAIAGDGRFAGVAVTEIKTSDSGTIRSHDKSWGYIAIRGYCIASIDTAITVSGTGCALAVSATGGGLASAEATGVSRDVGTLLQTTSAAGKAPILLKG